MFVKLAFLIRHETALNNNGKFYDFVPYKYGPFSFTLYSDLTYLERNGYLILDEERIALCKRTISLAEDKSNELPALFHEAVDTIVRRYCRKSQIELVREVYIRYPWYAIRSELNDLRPKSPMREKIAYPAVYTAGYEGKSVDAFFNHLLKNGIQLIIDVRANPVSRRYGFSKNRFSDIAERLGLDYRHMPNLGIPSKYRVDLSGFDSYQRLLKKYEQEMIPKIGNEIEEVCKLMVRTPAVLVCFERDVRCCHRSRLADAVSRKIGLKVKHL
jgi:uncharacterized protein (DUF488 family)